MRTCPKCQRTYPDDVDYCPRDATALVAAVMATQTELESSLGQRFRIIRRLGEGGMGAVFLAEQIAAGNRPVALKVLLRKLLDDPQFLIRFRNEAASTGPIDHPNVVTIYESGQADDGTPYIAMQYLEGESLRARLLERGAMPAEECAAIVGQAARGLNAAHRLGIIHRDLKPDNIFLTKDSDGELLVKVVDFGIAKLRESATQTLTGTVVGTPAYMSFEQASGMKSEDLDARSDIYSFGVVAYEMLTGHVPFHSDTPLGYLRKHLSEEPPTFRAVKRELVAPQLEQVVMKALAKDRDARYASVLEFARAFAEAAKSAPAPALPLGTTIVAPKPSPPTISAAPGAAARTSRVSLWVGLPVVAALLGLAGWYLSSAIVHTRSTNPPLAPSVGTVWEDSKDGLKYSWIPPGTFMMGCSPGDIECADDEKPAHRVTISKGFWIGQTPVTVSAFRQYSRATATAMPTPPDFNAGWTSQEMPIVNVTWDGAVAFCGWAGGRVPTEAEREYAARAGSTESRYGPIDDVAWYATNSGNKTHDVAQKRPNAFKLYDMLGNEWEWVSDWYLGNYYAVSPERDPRGPETALFRVIRGGSWGDEPLALRVSSRTGREPGYGDSGFALRCVREMANP